jgi:AcrR family transcriptional regulator
MVFVSRPQDEPLPRPPWSTERDRPAVRRTLGREAIVDAAFAIVDAEGLEGLSMRRLAQALGTGAASLYAHISGRPELLQILLDRVAAEVQVPDPEPARWQDQVREVGHALRDALLPHRDLAGAALANIPTGDNTMVFTERLLAILRAGGVPDRLAALFIDKLPQLVTIDVYEGSLFGQRMAREPEYFAELMAYWQALPPERFPHFTAIVGDIAAAGEGEGKAESDARFSFGLELLVLGLAALAARG